MSIVHISDLMQDITRIHLRGLPRGFSTGWKTLDPLYSVQPGMWTLITGRPNHGKSEWLDALLVNLALREEWVFLIFSPENHPLEMHASKLIEKVTGKPFSEGRTERVSSPELMKACERMERAFHFIQPEPKQVQSLAWVIEQAMVFIAEHRKETRGAHNYGLIVDPWNELEHLRPSGFSETEYISEALATLRQWARAENFHAWIVAHPKLPLRDKDGKVPVPTPYDVAGSAHWYNKADFCITVWRSLDDHPDLTQIHVQKVRFKHLGRPGMVELMYDKVTGRYADLKPL